MGDLKTPKGHFEINWPLGCLMNDQNKVWLLPDDYLTTVWQLPEHFTVIAWWLPDCLIAAWHLYDGCIMIQIIVEIGVKDTDVAKKLAT